MSNRVYYSEEFMGQNIEVFDNELALSELFAAGVIFVKANGTNWSINVICSDTFYYASADCEEITFEELPILYKLWERDEVWGGVIFVMKKRNMRPLIDLEINMKQSGVWSEFELDSLPNRT